MIRTFTQHRIRHVQELNGVWSMTATGKKWMIAVPGCWEQIPELSTYQGTASYRRMFNVQDDDSTIRLIFKGVSHTANVYVDDEKVGHHYDAYIPFDVLVPHMRAGDHELRVEVSNAFGPDSALHIPNDYYSYGGITRTVCVETLPETYISEIHCTPSYHGGQWSATTEVTIANTSSHAASINLSVDLAGKHAIFESIGIPANDTKTLTWEQAFDDITPWSCGEPRLYELHAELTTDDGHVTDDLIDRIGFRTVSTHGRKLLLNGKPIFLKGFNRHEEYGSFGSAVPFEAMMQDIGYIKDLEANAVRTSHYPNDELFLDLCDETGLLVWEENHARGLNLERMQNPNFDLQCAQCNEAMVTNHYNHPSIVIWGLLNECASNTVEGRAKYQTQFAQIRELDTSRPVTSATCQHFADLCLGFADIVSVNLYNGWYESGSTEDRLNREIAWIDANDGIDSNANYDNADAGGTDDAQAAAAAPLKPIIVSEFGASALYGQHDPFGSQKWSEERQAAILEDNLHAYLSSPDLTGIFVWQFADNRVSEEEWFLTRPRLHNNKGIMDEFRRPKLAYSTVKRMLHECDAQGHQQFYDIDKESRKEMIRTLAIENGLLPDTDRTVTNIDEYFKAGPSA